ncbi:MAG: hypothetical protein H7844_12945 [Nitrospirae bacterium YQR-1]
MLKNKDFYGAKIINEDDPFYKKGADLLLHAAASGVPFGIRGMIRENKLSGEVTVKSLLPFIGITPAPAEFVRSKAENVMSEIMSQKVPIGGRTSEQQGRADNEKRLQRQLFMDPTKGHDMVVSALKEGTITPKEAMDMVRNSRLTQLQSGFKHLSIIEALKVYEAANNEEKKTLRQLLAQKSVTSIPLKDRREVIERKRQALTM